jgi:hypothetical protein
MHKLVMGFALAVGLTLVLATPAAAQAPGDKAQLERYQTLRKAAQDQYEARFKEFVAGKTTTDFLLPWSVKWLKAELTLTDRKAERLKAYKAHLERMQEAEKISKLKYDAGVIAFTQHQQTVYYRLEAEIWLEEAEKAK